LAGNSNTVKNVSFSKQSGLIIGTVENTAKIWQLEGGKLVHTQRLHSADITCLQV